MKHIQKLTSAVAVGVLLVGCATQPYSGSTPSERVETGAEKQVAPKPAAQVEQPVRVAPVDTQPVEPSTSEKNLAIALTSYERGEYAKAMRQLSPLTTDTTLGLPARLSAIKTLAFSQCLTGAVIACRGSFERAFKLDSKFDLAPAEQGHPLWGPQFELARKHLKIN